MADTKGTKTEAEIIYVIPLRRNLDRVPTYKRANKAVTTIKEFLVRHMKVRDRDLNKVKLDRYLNEYIWHRGIKKPPVKVKVKVRRDGVFVRAELAEMHQGLQFKKAKLEARKQKASEVKSKKKVEEKIEKPAETEQKEEEKKETEEKKSAVVEAGKAMEKAAAKTMKHQTKMSKQPKRQKRMALQK